MNRYPARFFEGNRENESGFKENALLRRETTGKQRRTFLASRDAPKKTCRERLIS